MKSFKYFLISIILLFFADNALACWGAWYTPKGYFMYRVYDNNIEPNLEISGPYNGAGQNCMEWQKITSKTISLKDIYHVIYEMTLDNIEIVYRNKQEKYENKFLEWITKKDTSILDFLILAKTNEFIRVKRNSRWYYPSMKTGAKMTLEEIAEKALSVDNVKLRDRYLLQAIRALFSLSKYEQCIKLWENEISRLPENNLMRNFIQPYIAGAEFHVNNSKKAIEYFAQLGDIESMLFCAGRSNEKLQIIDALKFVCEYAPNSKFIEKTLQSYIRNMEPIGDFYQNYKFVKTSDYDKLYALCLKMGREGKSNNPAMWYYTAAFLADLEGNTTNALRFLRLAEKRKASTYIRESIKIFRIYLDAKVSTYNSSYEQKLFSQLKWLDSKIQSNLDENVCKETACGEKLFNCESYYYWNDMMRKILLTEVCPRMIKIGNTTRALQLANMADNRLLELVNKQEVKTSYTKTNSRYSTHFNAHDYSNSFFELIDSIGLNAAIKYVNRVNKPLSEFDLFLNNRGYIDMDYLNDILGTQCLRNMNYRKAVKYLGAVDVSYNNHLNVSLKYNPFNITRKKIKKAYDFRYIFAKEMYSLEQMINLTTEPNRKAQLMLKYAIGIKNSFDICWELTQYYRGESFWGQVCKKRDWENDNNTITAMQKAKNLINQACKIATDDEVCANIQYTLCNFKTVAEKYPNTKKGLLVRGKCDNLHDYHIESY